MRCYTCIIQRSLISIHFLTPTVSLPAGAIGGIAVGAAVGLALIITLIALILLRKRLARGLFQATDDDMNVSI